MSSVTEGRISELGDRTIEITQFEQQRENRLKKRNSEVCGSITEDLTFMTLSLEGERERWCWKIARRNNGRMFTKFGKRNNPTNFRSWVNLNQGKPKEIHSKLIKILKTKDKGKIKKSINTDRIPYRAKTIRMTIDFSWSPEWSGTFFRCWKERTVNPDCYTPWK